MAKTVLIVEDEALTRSLCADVFEDAGFDTIQTANGDEALDLLTSGVSIDAIVSDIQMPGSVDGLVLRREVERRWPNVKMLLTSGNIQVERSELAQDQVFVAKPFKFLELVRQIEALLATDDRHDGGAHGISVAAQQSRQID